MASSHNCKRVSFSSIHDSDRWNIHGFIDTQASSALEQSVKRVGVLHPPTLIEGKNSSFDIVCGRQRLECERTLLEHDNCLCLILPGSTPSHQILLHLLEDQKAYGPLSLLEQAFFLHLCLQSMKEEEVLQGFLPLLGLKKSPPIIGQLLQLLSLDLEIQQAIHFGILSGKIIFELLKLQPSDQLAITNLISALCLGGNKQKRFFTLCKDHVMRTGTTISALLEEEEIQYVLNHREMNPPQKTNNLLTILQKRCFPLRTSAEENFKKEVQQLQLPECYELSHSPSFEKDEVQLSIRFKDLQSCKAFLPTLQECFRKT